LVCPLRDDQGALGDLWLAKAAAECFDTLEMQVVQQVADHCAIAIRQARLYQASVQQISELERLNHLKDDFLSTVSHELRTPITNMKMAIQLLKMARTPPKTGAISANPRAGVRARGGIDQRSAGSAAVGAGIQTPSS
jgi:signal transduction histidine kinase